MLRLPAIVILALLAWIAGGAATGCATAASKPFELTVHLAPTESEESVTVAIVLVSDPGLAQRLLDLSATDWFERRAALRSAGSPAFSEIVCALAPGGERTVSVTLGRDPAAAFVFTRTDGAPQVMPIDVHQTVHLALVDGEVTATQ